MGGSGYTIAKLEGMERANPASLGEGRLEDEKETGLGLLAPDHRAEEARLRQR
jgi:hypothetical protein